MALAKWPAATIPINEVRVAESQPADDDCPEEAVCPLIWIKVAWTVRIL